jgi:hypothetical protein
MVILDSDTRTAPQAPQLFARAQALAAALAVRPNSPEHFWLVATEAITAARTGDIVGALKVMDKVIGSPAFKGLPNPRLLNTYLRALAEPSDAVRAELAEVRALAITRYPADHITFRTIDYVDALLGASRDARDEKTTRGALETRVGRSVTFPLAPLWFGF